tara:strand:- start:1249 stop:2166 length:918 start_codon:yes stop_codon:yes gene_type:complete
MAVIAAIGAAVIIGGGLISSHQEKQAAKGFSNDAAGKAAEIRHIEANRQAIPNPYANFEDVSSMAGDLSGMMSNPYLNLGVATQAAEFQAEEADIALANTLDTLRSSGASAGGATALAQAALQSKRGVSASIETQEAQNQKAAAQGQENLQNAKISEATRQQGIQMSEAQRMQQAEAQGELFQYSEQESRDMQQLNRLSGQQQQLENNKAQAKANQNAAIGGIASGLGNIAGGFSDRRLKKNIQQIGTSNSGLKIYSFEYIDKNLGDGIFQGVMSDEIPKEAVIPFDGYDLVDYSIIDVEFKKIA